MDKNLYGDFAMATPDYLDMDMDLDDVDMLLSQLVTSDLMDCTETFNMKVELEMPADDSLPPPETPCQPKEKSKRFKSKTEQELKKYEDNHQSTSTRSNTKWGMKILQDWHSETYGVPLDVMTVPFDELNIKLGKFYCEARPQTHDTTHKNKQHDEYHKNSMKSIRAAINRHISDIGRDIDIVKDRQFKQANTLLSGMLKDNMTHGISRATQHKDIIGNADLDKVSTYLSGCGDNPIKLRLGVWYNISIHFVSRGLEFHHQLTRDSFIFLTDDNGKEYTTLTHETQQKNYQGGLAKEEPMADRRMYATNTPSCPVGMLKKIIEKTDKNALKLFNQCVKEAIVFPEMHQVWYTPKSIGKTTFTNFLPDICKQAGCSRRYTAHCLRATAIQAMSDAGWETRQIMYMSGHRNEASVRSYSRNMSTNQKQNISSTLSALTATSKENTDSFHPAVSVTPRVPRTTCTAVAVPSPAGIDTFSQSTMMSSFTSGMLTNSTFSNCSFNFNMPK